MADDDLINTFFRKYTTREETMYRLPMEVDINDFWPKELLFRQQHGSRLQLHSAEGPSYFFVRTRSFTDAANQITGMARTDSDFSVFSDLYRDSLTDEAYYSSMIEGAFSTREKARSLIESGKEPENKDELMIRNNYRALQFVLEQLDAPVSEALICRIGEILTDGTTDPETKPGYRDAPVYILSPAGKVIYTAPDADKVPGMMNELIEYINDPSVHPIEKAVISHIFFVTVHPFFDGNGRTARALTYMILLKAGYDFFRLIPISGILSEERSRYYKAIRACQDPGNGPDLTYFSDFYTCMLAGTLQSVKVRLQAMEAFRTVQEKLDPGKDSRVIRGAWWMVTDNVSTVTIEKWKGKFGVSFETARKDLMTLAGSGFVSARREGHRLFFDRQ